MKSVTAIAAAEYKRLLKAHLMNDEALAAVLLDRLLYHCEVIKQTGKIYRL
jgi:hypothetical protein